MPETGQAKGALLTPTVSNPGTGQPQRLYFHRLERTGVMLGAAETVAQLRAEARATSLNVGNLVHLEAPARMLRYNRRHAARFRAEGGDAFALIERQFDGIVLGYANIIRSSEGLDAAQREEALGPIAREAEWLATTRLPIYAMGIGLQDALDPVPDAIDPALLRLLTILNDRARIFAVRGDATRDWLHAIGLTNAVALGCPSLFVYPRNVLSVRPLDAAAAHLATAGRLQRNREENRIEAIDRIAAAIRTSYVFQNDFFTIFGARPAARVFDDATGAIDVVAARQRVREELGFVPAFADYWLFRSTEKWRGFAIGCDGYFGDRFHGGVVFLQCGKPAVIVPNDLRVRELVQFYDLPSATTTELLEHDPRELLDGRTGAATLSRFGETYRARYAAFHHALAEAGLELFNDIPPEDL